MHERVVGVLRIGQQVVQEEELWRGEASDLRVGTNGARVAHLVHVLAHLGEHVAHLLIGPREQLLGEEADEALARDAIAAAVAVVERDLGVVEGEAYAHHVHGGHVEPIERIGLVAVRSAEQRHGKEVVGRMRSVDHRHLAEHGGQHAQASAERRVLGVECAAQFGQLVLVHHEEHVRVG